MGAWVPNSRPMIALKSSKYYYQVLKGHLQWMVEKVMVLISENFLKTGPDCAQPMPSPGYDLSSERPLLCSKAVLWAPDLSLS